MILSAITLQGAAIRLEPMTHAHLPQLCAIGLDPALWRATVIQLQTEEEMARYVDDALASQHAGTGLPFVMVELGSASVVGSTRFHSIDPKHKRVEIGSTWISARWQRTAVNTEAKYLMLRHAFETWTCERVELRADDDNERSKQAIRRLGAVAEGVLREHRISAHRGPRNIAMFSIIAREWPAVRRALEEKLAART